MGPVVRAQWAEREGEGAGCGSGAHQYLLGGGIWFSQEHQEKLRGLKAKDRET